MQSGKIFQGRLKLNNGCFVAAADDDDDKHKVQLSLHSATFISNIFQHNTYLVKYKENNVNILVILL